jgi:hypothetical protein
MGVFAPAIPYVLGAVSVGAGVYSAVQQRQAGQMQAVQYAQEGKQEADSARQKEIDRRKTLLRALASQNAAAGAAGASMEGSLGNLARVDIEAANNDLLTDSVNSSRRSRVLRASGREALGAAGARATGSLIDSANAGYRNFG